MQARVQIAESYSSNNFAHKVKENLAFSVTPAPWLFKLSYNVLKRVW